ncbi:MAG TPA: exodeoxyribonuclease VII large subunit [Terriglobales bacterium]|nr:exodeoxyribonuclease VII large subunit [Terriglobales bacterium]
MSLGDQLGFTFQSARRVWTVAGLLAAVRTQLEREYTDVWVEGEISNHRAAESGHIYFTLKDDNSQLRAVIFRSQARLLRFRPENGLQVVARGRLTVYEARGEMQLTAEYLEPKGAGALQIAFEQLKAKLAAEGLFEAARKKAIPALPKRIGIVTSPRGAAIQDILNVLRRRHESVSVLIYPAQVQGTAAPGEIIAGIRHFNRTRGVDVILVARGGGSLEDLAAFNDEALARVAAGSDLPIISAVGHETDFTILDFIADLRAPTPSAAAELVIESKHAIEEQVLSLRHRLGRATRYRVLQMRQRLTELAQHGAFAGVVDAIRRRQQRVDDLVYRLASAQTALLRKTHRRLDVAAVRLRHHDLRRRLQYIGSRRESQQAALIAALRAQLQKKRARLQQATAQLQALSPTNILERGYALVFTSTGELVKQAQQVKTGEEITAQVAKGKIVAVVHEVKPR